MEPASRTVLFLAATAVGCGACGRSGGPSWVNLVTYRCSELGVSATFEGEERVELTLPDRRLTLTQVPAASGAKYADAHGNEFWTKGLSDGLLMLAGEPRRSCAAPAAAAPAN